MATDSPLGETPTEAIDLDADADLDRIFTIPNVITMVRLCALPIFVYLLFGLDDRWAAGWVLVTIGATDWVDGYLARRLNQVSNVGKILDPVADRLLFFVGVGAILIEGAVPVWIAVLVLVREVVITVATLVLAALGARRIDVTWYGKTATFLLMGAFPGFLVGSTDNTGAEIFNAMAWAASIPGIALSYYSAALYLPMGREALRLGRADRAQAAIEAD